MKQNCLSSWPLSMSHTHHLLCAQRSSVLCISAVHSQTAGTLGIQESTWPTDLQLTSFVITIPSIASNSTLILLLPHFNFWSNLDSHLWMPATSPPLRQRNAITWHSTFLLQKFGFLSNCILSFLLIQSEFGEWAWAIASLTVFLSSIWKRIWRLYKFFYFQIKIPSCHMYLLTTELLKKWK